MSKAQKPFILCLMGPTASGKTALAVELVQRFPCEIVSVDSAMVYRGMDIGTAKPPAEILQIAPHRLLDLCDPSEAYSAGTFKVDALREIDDILKQGKVPLLTGGTMLYFHVLQHGIDELPKQDQDLRSEILLEAEALGWPALHAQLAAVDPVAGARIHPNDSQRIQRALEVYRLTGKPLTDYQLLQHGPEATPAVLPFDMHHLILSPNDRSVLHRRIELRFAEMLELGFVEEVQGLYQREDLSLETPALRSVGYRQVWEYLQGKMGYEEMREKAVIATRQLAKRQLTWLRRWENASWFDSEKNTVVDEVVKRLAGLF